MRTAIVSSSYNEFGGTEKVDNIFGKLYPDADLFLLFGDSRFIPEQLRGRVTSYSALQKLPGITKAYRGLMPIYPYAVGGLDLRGYDLVISSDHGVMKGVLTDDDCVHICYCHTPWRQIWDLYWPSLAMVPRCLHPVYALTAQYLREWDFSAAQRVDRFCANSRHIARRIQKHYRRGALVIYPPVDTSRGYIARSSGGYYLSVGRLSPTKRTDLLVDACTRLGRKLIVCGTGREAKRLKGIAGPTIEFVGGISDQQLAQIYANCRALLFAAYEDFGIAVVEAQSYGRPVIAFGKGGATETVRTGFSDAGENTGIIFPEQTTEAVIDAIRRFEQSEWQFQPSRIQENSRLFDTAVFESRFRAFVDDAMSSSRSGPIEDAVFHDF